jgi:hypothetical protein
MDEYEGMPLSHEICTHKLLQLSINDGAYTAVLDDEKI